MKGAKNISVDFKDLKCTVTFDKGDTLVKDVVKVTKDFDNAIKLAIGAFLQKNDIELTQWHVQEVLETLTVDEVLSVIVSDPNNNVLNNLNNFHNDKT
jgi:hypothetical protein